MATIAFSRDYFEAALGNTGASYQHLGLVDGEHTYLVDTAHPRIKIFVRSSIRSDGYAADAGQDSIRLMLASKAPFQTDWHFAGRGPDAYTQRTRGWERRLSQKLAQVKSRANQVQLELVPHERVWFSKQTGRPYGKVGDTFRWLDVEEPQLIVKESTMPRTNDRITKATITDFPHTATDGTAYTITYERDWTWVFFGDKPAEQVRRTIGQVLAFRWSKRRSGWYAQRQVAEADIHSAIGQPVQQAAA